MIRIYSRFIAVLMVAAMFSCNDADVDINRCYVTEATYDEPGLDGTSIFQYQNNKIVTAIHTLEIDSETITVTTNYSYNSKGRLVKSESFEDGFSTGYLDYIYDSNGRIKRIDYYTDVESEVWSQEVYKYNEFGQKIEFEIIYTSFPDVFISKYEYPNSTTRNPSKITQTINTDVMVVSLEYDNHPIPTGGFFESGEADNNVTKTTVELLGDNPQTIINSIEYVYNDQGFPISSIDSDGNERGWSYNCK